MKSLMPTAPCENKTIPLSVTHKFTLSICRLTPQIAQISFVSRPIRCPLIGTQHSHTVLRSQSLSNSRSSEEDGENPEAETFVEDLKVPDHWLLHSKAVEESNWLRITLHKWLDDEYCPEETNVEISKIAAQSYYESLLEKQTDLGKILLKMVRSLQSISYQESFHGAFSSANAAVNLIAQRIEHEGKYS